MTLQVMHFKHVSSGSLGFQRSLDSWNSVSMNCMEDGDGVNYINKSRRTVSRIIRPVTSSRHVPRTLEWG